MSKLITEMQKKEIELLAVDHHDALIAYGRDAYRKGMIRGAILASVGVLIGAGIGVTEYVIKHKKI